MPVKIEKLPGDKVRVSTPGGVKAKATSFQKAMAQKRLLNAVEHSDWRPTKDPMSMMKKKKPGGGMSGGMGGM